MKYEWIDILGVEKEENNNKFTVEFEVPGKPHGKNYPERRRMTFDGDQKWFEKRGGEPIWKHHLKDRFLKSRQTKKQLAKRSLNDSEVEKKVSEISEKHKGKHSH